jgi:hypothetical protein
MSNSISETLIKKGYNPDDLINHLRETLRQERDIYDTKKKYLTPKEQFEHEMRLMNMESLLITLLMENVDSKYIDELEKERNTRGTTSMYIHGRKV